MTKMIAFHGTDHKVGVTMVSQSAAEMIADARKEMKLLFVSLSGRCNTEYIREEVRCIDHYKVQMDSRMISGEEVARSSRVRENLSMIGGVSRESEQRFYFPEAAEYLMETVRGEFDLVVMDTGSDLDNGLSLGGLTLADHRFLVMNQLESGIRRMENLRETYENAGIRFDRYVVNQFREEDPHTIPGLARRLALPGESFFCVREAEGGRRAETDKKTLIRYKNERYIRDITALCDEVLAMAGKDKTEWKKKGKWKSFI